MVGLILTTSGFYTACTDFSLNFSHISIAEPEAHDIGLRGPSTSLPAQSVTSATDDGWVASVRVNVVGKELQGATYPPLPECTDSWPCEIWAKIGSVLGQGSRG